MGDYLPYFSIYLAEEFIDEHLLMNIYNKFGEDFVSEPIDIEPIKAAVKKQLHQFEKKGEDIIPITSYEKIFLNGGRLPENIERKLKRRGILVIKNTITEELIRHWETNILRYLYDNNAFPKKNQVYKYIVPMHISRTGVYI